MDFDPSVDLHTTLTNHPSALAYPEDIKAYLEEELSHKAIMGPFSKPPLQNLHVSPFLTRDKPNSDHRRVIMALSYPKGNSVNAGVDSATYLGTKFLLTLPSIDLITQKVKNLGKGCLIYKIDISRAFRHLTIDPYDSNLLGLQVNGQYFYDLNLPFGYRHGSSFFQRISDAIL